MAPSSLLSRYTPATVPTDPTGTTDPKTGGRTGAERSERANPVTVGSMGTVGSVPREQTDTPKPPPTDPIPIGFEIIEVDPDEVPDCSCGRTMASQGLDGIWRCNHCSADEVAERRRTTERWVREVHRIRSQNK